MALSRLCPDVLRRVVIFPFASRHGGVRSLVSQEASLSYSMFAAVGVVVGIGVAVIYRRRSTAS